MSRRLALVLVLAGCRSAGSADNSPSLVPIDGPGVVGLVKASDAPAVVVNLWATWCAPCKEEFPTFVEVGRTYADRGVELHFVSLDFPEESGAALDFLKSQGAPLPSWLKKGKDHAFITALHSEWSGALPATFIYDSEGRLRSFFEGQVDRPTLVGAVEALLAPAP